MPRTMTDDPKVLMTFHVPLSLRDKMYERSQRMPVSMTDIVRVALADITALSDEDLLARVRDAKQ